MYYKIYFTTQNAKQQDHHQQVQQTKSNIRHV